MTKCITEFIPFTLRPDMFLQFGVLLLWTFYVQGQVLDRCIFVSNFKTQYLGRPELPVSYDYGLVSVVVRQQLLPQ